MILVDTSIWIDHFRSFDQSLGRLIESGLALGHPYVIGELAVGNLRDWRETVTALIALPRPSTASQGEFLALLAGETKLIASGLGFVDVHLLASCRLTPGTLLWTRDARLRTHARALDLEWIEKG